MLSVIIPASNEEGYIGPCLAALLASSPVSGGAEAIVVANGCRDRTADVARGMAPQAAAAGWGFRVIDRAEGGKPAALDAGDAAALADLRAYLDADVIVSPPVMAQLAEALAGPEPRYASGTAMIPPAKSWVTRAYARFWQKLPFAAQGVTGAGLFAVNAAGRARWGAFPQIISDDTFARLQFDETERFLVAEPYEWPLVEGFSPLVRVRRRQDQGVAEIARLFPELIAHQGHVRPNRAELLRLAASDPIGFATYSAVALAVRTGRNQQEWARGR